MHTMLTFIVLSEEALKSLSPDTHNAHTGPCGYKDNEGKQGAQHSEGEFLRSHANATTNSELWNSPDKVPGTEGFSASPYMEAMNVPTHIHYCISVCTIYSSLQQ